jgi:hypothetical protein
MFIFLDFSLNTSRAGKKGGVELSKNEYAISSRTNILNNKDDWSTTCP